MDKSISNQRVCPSYLILALLTDVGESYTLAEPLLALYEKKKKFNTFILFSSLSPDTFHVQKLLEVSFPPQKKIIFNLLMKYAGLGIPGRFF